jgi:hypothetical protein
MAPSPARTKTEDPGDGTTSIRVGPRVDKESSRSLRERLLVDGAMTSAGGEIFGVEVGAAELVQKNRPPGMKSSGVLREVRS